MDWRECQERMGQYVIKKDGTAVDTEYFMATHVPFRDLEVIEYGHTKVAPIHLTEEEIYKQYIVNPFDKHQMVIVRGSHGSGKSHLICWLYNRFVGDSENYDPSKERVIFLRRLNNTVRGAVQQMLDEEGLVQDPEVREKFEKFTQSTQSQNKEEFKTTIYTEYAKKAQNDTSNKHYKTQKCKDIAAFLYDPRVQEYMMGSDGPVERCYQMITGGANSIVTEEMEDIFQTEDFVFSRNLDTSIKKDAGKEAKDFYFNEVWKNKEGQKTLALYLNQFTSGVIQGCANITSENARDLFVELRKSLYQEGRNLTILIEDFTSFSIVENELITALAVENGGSYSDLCRVTSVIGITDGYYESFRDNFKTRVTTQIEVTEQSFSETSFLLEMTARYLNAIYCTTDSVLKWYREQPVEESLPVTDFKPDYKWDEFKIGERSFTLYPFNEKSILALYNNMQEKTTRNFLTYVIQHFFFSFADGMQYENDWQFPDVPSFITIASLQPPYSDTVENSSFSERDKKRLNELFSVWGNGTTTADENEVGGICKEFLNEIGLGKFEGVQAGERKKDNNEEEKEEDNVNKAPKHGQVTPRKSPEEASFDHHQEDVESWYHKGAELQYSADFSRWLGDFVAQGIPWQDEGLPGYLASERRRSGEFVYIEGTKQQINRNKAVVIVERNPETRTIFLGLNLFNFYQNWDFDSASYYQYILTTWLEKNKNEFIDRIYGEAAGKRVHPIMTWCLAGEYFSRLLQGEEFEESSNEALLRYLITTERNESNSSEREDKKWIDVQKFIENNEQDISTILKNGSKTMMGVVGERAGFDSKFYRTRELLNSLQYLDENAWDIRSDLEFYTSLPQKHIRDYLLNLYTRLDAVLEEEKRLAESAIKEFEDLVGAEPSKEKYIDIVKEVRSLFEICSNKANEPFSAALAEQFDDRPGEQAEQVINLYNELKNSLENSSLIDSLRFFSRMPVEKFNKSVKVLSDVRDMAEELKNRRSGMLDPGVETDLNLKNTVLSKLDELKDRVHKMEVSE